MAAASSPDPIATVTEGIKRLTDGIGQIVVQAVRQVQAVLTQVVAVVTRVAEVIKRVVTQIVSILLPGPPVNQSPVVAVVTVSLPDPGAGVVTGMVSASDPDGDPVTFTAPAGTAKGTVAVDSSSGAFIYTPTEAARHAAAADGVSAADRSDTFTVTAVDGRGGSTVVQVTVVVAAANAAPKAGVALVGAPDPATGVVTGTVIAGDPDGDSLTFVAPASTAKGTVVVDSSSGAFTYTPTVAARESAAQSGAAPADKADTLIVTVADGHGGSIEVPISVVVSPAIANQSPVVAVVTVSLPDPGTGVVTGMVSASDPDGDAVTFSSPAGTPKGTIGIDPITGTFTYTPTTAARDAAAREFAIRTSTAALPSVSDLLGSVRPIPETTLAYVDSYDSSTGIFSIAVFDFATQTVVATIPFTTPNTQTDDLVVNSDGTRAYVTTITYDDAAARSDKVSWIGLSVIDTKAHAIIATIPFTADAGINPTGRIAINPSGTRLYVPTYNYGVDASGELTWGSSSMTVIDTAINTIIATVPFPGTSAQGTFADPGLGPLAVNPDGTRVYVATWYTDPATSQAQSAFSVIDTATNAIVGAIAYPQPDTFMRRMTFSPDGTRLYVDSCSDVRCDGTTDTVIVLDTVANTVAATVAHPAEPGSTPWAGDQSISPDGRYLYVAATDEIFDDNGDLYARTGSIKVIDTATNAIIGAIGFPPDVSLDYDTYPVGIALSADGTRLHVITETATYQNGDNSVTGAAVMTYAIDQAALAARSDTFTVTVSDGRGGLTAVPVAIAVTADPQGGDDGSDNRAPTPGAPTLSIDPITGIVTGSVNAVDPDGDSLTYEAFTAITGKGIVDVTATGRLTYTPSDPARHTAAWVEAPAADKTYSIAVTVTDIHGATATLSIALPISPQNTAPTGEVALNAFYLFSGTPYGTADTYNGRVTGILTVADADGDFATATATAAKGTVVAQLQPFGGRYYSYYEFTYTPNADARAAAGAPNASLADATDTVDLVLDDGHGGITRTALTVTVAPTHGSERIITVGNRPTAVALSPNGTRAYVMNAATGTLSVIDTATNTVIATVPVGTGFVPDITVSPQGNRAVVTFGSATDQNAFVLVNTTTNQAVATVELTNSGGLGQPVFNATGSRLYVPYVEPGGDADHWNGRVAVVDPVTGAVLSRLDYQASYSANGWPGSLFANPVDDRVYGIDATATLLVVDPTTNHTTRVALGPEVLGNPDSGRPVVVGASSDGRTLYAVNWLDNTVSLVDTNSYSVTTSQLGPGADDLEAGDGVKLRLVVPTQSVQSSSKWLAILDNTGALSAVIPGPGQTSAALTVDRRTLFSVDWNSGNGLTFDPLTGSVTGALPADYYGAVVAPGGRIYLTSPDYDTLTVLQPDQLTPVDPAWNLARQFVIGGLESQILSAGGYEISRQGYADMAVTADGRAWILSNRSDRLENGQYVLSTVVTVFDPSNPEEPAALVLSGHHEKIVTGADGQLYAISISAGRIDVINPDDASVRVVTIPDGAGGYLPGVVVDELGRIYVGSSAISPDGSVESLPVADYWSAIAPDGSIYGGRYGSTTLHQDRTYTSVGGGWGIAPVAIDQQGRAWNVYTFNQDAVGVRSLPGQDVADRAGDPARPTRLRLADNLRVYDAAVTPEGLAYVPIHSGLSAEFGSVLVIDPNTYGTSKVYSIGKVPDIPGAFDAATSEAGYAYIAGRDPLSRRLTVTVIGPKTADTPAEPVRVDASYARLGFGPTYVQGLWANVFDNATGVNDGVLVQTVRGEDGLLRAIAYIGGTTGAWGLTPEDNQGILENAISRLGIPKPDQVDAIKAELARCEASPSCGPVEEILLVGYSQGGMDAQNLAFWNALGTPIAGVVTFGSPIIAANPAVTTLHIQDSFDGVVNIAEGALSPRLALNPATLLLLEGPRAWAQLHGDIYKARSGTPVNSLLPFGEGSVHSNRDTYLTLSEWFTNSAESEYATQKTVVSRFLGGTLIGNWPPTPALFGTAV